MPLASKRLEKHRFYKVFGALGFQKASFYKVFGALGFKKLSFYKVFGALGFKKGVTGKGGEFKGTCASQNPYLNTEGEECGYCGKTVSPGSDCKKD